MKVPFCTRGCVGALVLSAGAAAFAGVTVKQNVSPGATSWPGAPIITTLANPSGASVVESFNGGTGGNTNLSQTFTITATNYTLQSISIYAGTGSGTGSGTNLTLKLYDLGSQAAPNPSAYAANIIGSDLFGGGAGLSASYSPQAAGVLEFDFDGTDQVTLTNGHMYAFELTGVLNSTPVFWNRGVGDTYAGGAAYRNQGWINGNNARDFALAVYATGIGSSNPPPMTGPNGIVFHAFTLASNGINQDGANPAAGLVEIGGVLYGTTANGGPQGAGTAFAMAPDASTFSVIRAFADVPDAARPQGNFTVSGGRFFGSGFAGGASGLGTVYSGQTNGVFSLVRSFTTVQADTATNTGGASPNAIPVIWGATLFGTTTAGGANANGTVFSVTTNGPSFSVLHDFSALDSGAGTNVDGAAPWGGLILSGATLFGTASVGGSGGDGVVFSVNTNGANFTTLCNFSAMDPDAGTNADGAFPMGGLVLSNATLYGTTMAGGSGGKGTIFSLGTNGVGFAVLHSFSPVDPLNGTNADGASPCATMILSGASLYGTATAGGAGGSGTVYSINTNGTAFACLHSFASVNTPTGTNLDGAQPIAQLLLLDNALYGTTFGGGPNSAGTVFSLALPPVPALISNIVVNIDGSVTILFVGQPNSTNVVQATSALTSPAPWQNVSTNVADANGQWQFTDLGGNPAQFFRSYAW